MSGLLDTSVVLGPPAPELPDEAAISVITLAELRLGVLVATTAAERSRRLERLVLLERTYDAIAIDDDVASAYARIIARRARAGSPAPGDGRADRGNGAGAGIDAVHPRPRPRRHLRSGRHAGRLTAGTAGGARADAWRVALSLRSRSRRRNGGLRSRPDE